MNEPLKTAITELAWKTPYKPYSIGKGIVEKIFNNGNGSLPVFRFDETTRTVKVNRAIANIYDRRKLKMFMEDNGISDWDVKEVYYGYPDWYSDMQLDINYTKLYEIALIRSSVTDAGICIPAFGFIVPRC